jgi:saccharopine dehydrogenase-like NADP-dependent oxidoreductase
LHIQPGGNIGEPIFNALVASNKFELTVLTRTNSSFTLPTSADNVKVVKVDYSDHNALVEALKGHDALLITIGDLSTLAKNSMALIDAAVDAGVKRVLPSEYSS